MNATPFRHGILFEISPSGTGFLEDQVDGSVYGFHYSALVDGSRPDGLTWAQWLEGRTVSFRIDEESICDVFLVESASKKA